MGHYLSDMLPDPEHYCNKCRKPYYPLEQIAAWCGYLRRECFCKRPSLVTVEKFVRLMEEVGE